uniref:Uncharacterized protein n=1 Tax=Arundo donax TaxID=35708 RepID=A0A0A9DQI2_ARUDO
MQKSQTIFCAKCYYFTIRTPTNRCDALPWRDYPQPLPIEAMEENLGVISNHCKQILLWIPLRHFYLEGDRLVELELERRRRRCRRRLLHVLLRHAG